GPVTNLMVKTRFVLDSLGNLVPVFDLSWSAPVGRFVVARYDLYTGPASGTELFFFNRSVQGLTGTIDNRNFTPGSQRQFAVIAVSPTGAQLAIEDAARVTHTV